jgi:transcriptional regulator with XRE-family HTH domain
MFTTNKIALARITFAEEFKKAREEKKISLVKAAKQLNINKKYLEAIEGGNFKDLPEGIYGKKFLGEYAIFLKLDPEITNEVYEKIIRPDKREKKEDLFSKKVVRNWQFIAAPKIIKNILITGITLICLAYLGYSVGKIVSGPELKLIFPGENFITNGNEIAVVGITESESEIVINGESALSDKQGNFSKKINLKEGINTITVTAKKKFSKEHTIERQILVK